MSSTMQLTTTTDIELVVSASVLERAKIKSANLYPIAYLSPAVLWFAQQMEAKLQHVKVRDRGDSFKQISLIELLNLMKNEVKELEHAIHDNEENIAEEAVDVANFAMFVAINRAIEKGVAK